MPKPDSTTTATARKAASRRNTASRRQPVGARKDSRAGVTTSAALVPFPPSAGNHPTPSGKATTAPWFSPTDALKDPSRRSDVDEWGRSERTRRLVRQLESPLYDKWFRVEWEGIDKIPQAGGALLIANHAAAIPSDAPMIMHGVEKELGRPVYGLADNWFRTIPGVGTGWSRSGGVPAHPDNAHRLLHDHGQLALVFPEGSKGPSKTFSERYRLRRFGRGGFVETAMRAGVPVVPIAVVGAEESMPILYKSRGLARTLGLPYAPLTANHLLLGPLLGSLVYLPAKFTFRVLDPVTFDVEPNLDRYPRGRVMEEAESIRQQLQENLYDMLAKRRSIWFG